ncbi:MULTISPECIES: NADP-dependent oxidoreductase [Kitasatospora]|uniref:Putative oxidoreductase n=1 Tax=Kitasatospora setae (strain ATCC 33774 / DSM 43861 / JCM 3304 / KCC A-0304 / NBRC 14216 / KM-6054) TaxID=452652 RepID=E4N0X2_KITSK|nr:MULTISPECIES: NADP-dependent oxidoreductase [Kitasatospora]BAJ31806.1 putative oxidoreductase [Kitasatospora setae KM-6054]
MPVPFRAVHQIARPTGLPTADLFAFVDGVLPALAEGEALVENAFLSVDPYMLGLMDDEEDGYPLHAPLEGRAVGRVVESRSAALPVGTAVIHREGWRTHAVVAPGQVRVLPELPGVPLSAHLSVLGGTGLSAYVGLTRIAGLKPGEDFFVSAAAGGVGTAAGQLARLLGARRVVGSAGSAAKTAFLTGELGFDAAFDYHAGPVAELLAEAAPTGIDVYLDNVGGEHLEAAIGAMRDYGRIAWCGAISQYGVATPAPAAPHNLFELVARSVRLEGFLVRHHLDAQQELYDLLAPQLRSGRVRAPETVLDGFDHIVEAFLGVLAGANTGKMLVRI